MKGIILSFVFMGWVLMVSPVFLFAGERTLIDGIVNTVKDNRGDVTAVHLNLSIQGEKVVHVVLDETGKKLGMEMDGKWVEVIGDVCDQDGGMWIEVKSYKNFKENIFE